MMRTSKILSLLILFSFNLFSYIKYKGNNGSDTTFNFPISGFASVPFLERKFVSFYVTAGQAVSRNDFAVARTASTSSNFEPLAPETIILNGVGDSNNPLYGAKIGLLALNSQYPMVVLDGDVKLYGYTDMAKLAIVSSKDLSDANSLPTASILKICSGIKNYCIAPVLNNAGDTFGAIGSGLALAYIAHIVEESENKKKTTRDEFIVLNADPSNMDNASRAVPLNNSSEVLKVGSDVQILSNIVDVYYDSNIGRFYIAVQAQSNSAASSGARAVVVARIDASDDKSNINASKIKLSKIVPDNALVSNNLIIGTGLSDDAVSIFKIRTMRTSTELDYLIVLGGNGTAGAVQNKMYALPLVNLKTSSQKTDVQKDLQGSLAKFDQIPTDYFNDGIYYTDRAFTEPAEVGADLLTNSSVQAIIGGGDLPIPPSGSISGVVVDGDTVFVSSSLDYSLDSQPGIFASTAMFDSYGRIKSWTPWQRVGGTDELVDGISIDLFRGNYVYISDNSFNVKRTDWSPNKTENDIVKNSSNLIKTLNDTFMQDVGGAQNLVDFSRTNQAFNDFSMMAVLGLRQICLVESGSMQGGFFKYSKGDFASNSVYFSNGSTGLIPANTKCIFISYGALNQLASIDACQVAHNSIQGKSWLFVGGVGGLALLSDSNGSSWLGQISNLSDIPSGLRFKVLGDFKFVLKILSDNFNLYVLTIDGLYRIPLSPDNFKTNNLNITKVADSAKIGAMADFLVSGPLCLLATSNGLFRIGNAKDISTVSSSKDAAWKSVVVPGSLGSIFKLMPLSSGVNQIDFANDGQLYAFSSYIGYQLSTVNRFTIKLNSGVVDGNVIQPLPDLFIKNTLSYIIDFSNFRNSYNCLNSFNLATVSRDVNNVDSDDNLKKPSAWALKPDIHSGSFYQYLSPVNLINFPDSSNIINTSIFLRSASGGGFVAGDFGVFANE